MTIRAMPSTQVAAPVKFSFVKVENQQCIIKNDSYRTQQLIVDADDFTLLLADENGQSIKVRNLKNVLLPLNSECVIDFISVPRQVIVMEI